ncbi:hypothetical protein [Acinetobacter junii]|uniref:hypothetical protein n=1 Tax=Acinetobacter junii TaxID=40215 RepID=UPI001FB219AD|nr:hypothetical protein [Acinetobacter junii]UOB51295.1 hypothetical protein MRY16_09100 [Acinetobacter junii]
MPNNINYPNNASPKQRAVVEAYNDLDFSNSYLSSFFPSSQDIGTKHWGLENNVFFKSNTLESDVKSLLLTNATLNDQNLNKVLIYSTFNHYIDGFKYFKNFLKSILNNDFKIAAHLLYYAEFRWLAALLGSQGIHSIGQSTYIYSTSNGFKNSNFTRGGSHEALWMFFTHWCETLEAENLFRNSFSVQNISIADWVSATNNMASVSTSSKILSSLIFDLTSSSKMNYLSDRNFRNKASYDGLNKPSAFNDLDLKFSFDFLASHFNGLLSLDSDNDFFEILDLEILKVLITQNTCQSTGNNESKKQRRKQLNKIYKSIDNACTQLNQNKLLVKELVNSISKKNIFENLLLQEAEETDNQALLKIFYRALLLMKLASSSLKALLSNAGLNIDYLKPWALKKISHSCWFKGLELDGSEILGDISHETRLDYFTSFSDLEEDFISMSKNEAITDLWDIDDRKNMAILRLSDVDIASIWSLA